MLNKEWSTAIEGFLVYDRALGKRSTTNSARRQHLQHLARRVTVGPWAVTGDVLIDYLGAQEWAQETRRGRRTSFDRFYRWAIYRGFLGVQRSGAHRLPRAVPELVAGYVACGDEVADAE